MPFYVRPDGCGLYYELHGEPSAEAFVLLEGAGGDIPGWGRHLEALARELRTIAFDLPRERALRQARRAHDDEDVRG